MQDLTCRQLCGTIQLEYPPCGCRIVSQLYDITIRWVRQVYRGSGTLMGAGAYCYAVFAVPGGKKSHARYY